MVRNHFYGSADMSQFNTIYDLSLTLYWLLYLKCQSSYHLLESSTYFPPDATHPDHGLSIWCVTSKLFRFRYLHKYIYPLMQYSKTQEKADLLALGGRVGDRGSGPPPPPPAWNLKFLPKKVIQWPKITIFVGGRYTWRFVRLKF